MKKDKQFFLKELSARLGAIKAKDIMTPEVATIPEDAPLAEVAKVLMRRRISGLPVTNRQNKVVGVVTAKDLFIVMDMIESGEAIEDAASALFDPTVRFAMSKLTERVTKNTPLDEVIALVKYHNLYTVPVFEGARLAGVIGRRDIFKVFYTTVSDIVRAQR